MESVVIASGEVGRFFAFSLNADGSPNRLITATGSSQAIRKERVYSTFQATVTGSGAVSGTVVIDATNDDKTGMGLAIPVGLNSNTTVTSPGLFNGFIDPVTTRWVPPVEIGDLVIGPGIPASTTVASIASASSLTISNPATVTGLGYSPLFQSANWIKTPLATITLTSTNFDSDGFSTSAAWRWVRARVTAIGGTGATIWVVMGV